MLLTTSDNKLQFKSPIRYSSKFSASILSIILSKVEKRSGDDCGGLYQVVLRKGSEPAGFRGFNSEIFKIIRTKISTKLKIDITTNINTNTTTIPAIALTVFANYTITW